MHRTSTEELLDLLERLPRYQAFVRLLVDGQPSRPFSMRTLPPNPHHDTERAAIIRRTSRNRYTRDVADVQKEIEREMGGVRK